MNDSEATNDVMNDQHMEGNGEWGEGVWEEKELASENKKSQIIQKRQR